MNIRDCTTKQPLMVLMKGEPKTGKKHAWASFPEPIYCMDTDYRMASLVNDPLYNKRDIQFDSYDSFNNLWYTLEELQEKCPYKTVVLHSLTTLGRLIQEYLFENRGVSEDSRNVAIDKKEKRNLRVGIIPIMGIPDFLGETSALAGVCMKMRLVYNRFNVNVVMVSHVITTETSSLDGKTNIHRILLTGGNKIAAEIPSYFNEVWHFDVDSGITNDQQARYLCRTQPSPTDFAGTSLYGVPPVVDFTNRYLYDEITRYLNPELKNEAL